MNYFTETKTDSAQFVEFLSNTTFVLGAADPEMVAIKNALVGVYATYDFKPNVAQAMLSDKPVLPATAYKAAHVEYLDKDIACHITRKENGYFGINDTDVCFVECLLPEVGKASNYVIDHHNPGDTGFNGKPEQYWEASSIGQVYRLLQSRGASPAVLDAAFGKDRYYIAAADHCPTYAFRGLCPGIDPYYLLQMRASQGAEFLGISKYDWLWRLAIARDALASLPMVETPYGNYAVATETINFLNHASMVDGVAVEYRMEGNPRDPRRKVGLLGAEPDLIRYWMEKAIDVYDDVYGSPERGYCGAYVRS